MHLKLLHRFNDNALHSLQGISTRRVLHSLDMFRDGFSFCLSRNFLSISTFLYYHLDQLKQMNTGSSDSTN